MAVKDYPTRYLLAIYLGGVGTFVAAIITVAGYLKGTPPPPPPPKPVTVIYRGRLMDDRTQAPLRNLKVSIDANPAPILVYTDDQGIFVATLPAENMNDDVRIRINVEGYEPVDRTVIPNDKRIEEFRLHRLAKVEPHPPPVAGNDGAAANRFTRYYNPNIAALGGRALLIVDQRLGLDVEMMSTVSKSVNATDALFRPSFVTEGLFNQVYNGDLDPLRGMHLDRVKSIVLAQESVRTSTEEVANSTIVRADVVINIRIVFPERGYSADSLSVTADSVDFNQNRAISLARDKAIANLIKRLS